MISTMTNCTKTRQQQHALRERKREKEREREREGGVHQNPFIAGREKEGVVLQPT
jgi:hypothetical protein